MGSCVDLWLEMYIDTCVYEAMYRFFGSVMEAEGWRRRGGGVEAEGWRGGDGDGEVETERWRRRGGDEEVERRDGMERWTEEMQC